MIRRLAALAALLLGLHAALPHDGLHEALSATQSVTVASGDHLHAAAASGCRFANLASTPAAIDADCAPIPVWNGVPVCDGHDPRIWHPLVERNADQSVRCTYTHHHGDDPHAVDDLLGPPGAYWGASGESLSYPWQTSTVENGVKHNLFKVIVRRDLPPLQAGQNYFKAFRATTHLLGSGGAIPGSAARDGFQTQVHSWALEAILCTPDDVCGVLRTGGHQDIGAGFLMQPGYTDHTGELCVLANAFDGSCQQAITRHIHGAVGSFRQDFTWYASTRPTYRRVGEYGVNIDFGTIGQDWSQVDPGDYDALPTADGTASWLSQEILALYLDPGMPGWTGWGTNRVNLTGYTDNWGNLALSGCGMPAVNCVPLVLDSVPAQATQYRDSFLLAATGTNPIRNHDVTVNGLSMTKYPN